MVAASRSVDAAVVVAGVAAGDEVDGAGDGVPFWMEVEVGCCVLCVVV